MGILKNILEKLFSETVKKEEKIEIDDIDVEIVSFTDNNGKYHERGYKPINTPSLRKLLERMIEVRGDEGDFNDIDTSEIESMESLFEGNETFNGNITGWKFPKVKYMGFMFCNAKSFNQPIGNWEFPEVKHMSCMFKGATSFNQDISNWDIRGVHNFLMFINCPIKDEFKPKMQ